VSAHVLDGKATAQKMAGQTEPEARSPKEGCGAAPGDSARRRHCGFPRIQVRGLLTACR
jgi:hypothetical protein